MLGRVKTGQGFSLVEVMVVVAIIGALVAVGVPNYIIWNQKYQLKSEVGNLAGNLGRARMIAINTNTRVTVTVTQAAPGVPVNVAFTNPAGTVLPAIIMNSLVSLSDVNGNLANIAGTGVVKSPQSLRFSPMGIWVNAQNANNICMVGAAPTTPCPATPNSQVLNFVNSNAVNHRIVILPTGKVAWCYTGNCVN